MKKLAWASIALLLSTQAHAQHPCWTADRQINRFLREEETRFDALAYIQHVLLDLERQVALTQDLIGISRSVTEKVSEQRELTRELIASLNRLRFELQQCSRR